MKKLILLSILFISANTAFSQAPDFDDCKILFADGSFEKLVVKAEKYTMKDDYKKNPIPYMWLSKGLYKISISGNSDPKYKNAYKDAIGAMSKSIKYDKDSSIQVLNEEYINELRMSLVQRMDNDISAEDFRKASGWVNKYSKISSNDVGGQLLAGACKYKANDKGGAKTLWTEANKTLNTINSVENWCPADLLLLKIGVLNTVECQMAARQADKAKELLNKVAPWFENDDDFKAVYDEVIN
jgi:hypothetical protein